ncbi:hypothetical protein Tco_0628440, partial [Tanacetum coccineum]
KTTTRDVHDNDTNVLPKEHVLVEPEKPVGSNKVLTNDQPQITSEPVVQPSNEVQQPPVPFPRRLRKEKDEAQQKKFLENLKQLYINLPFIEALAQMPKYAKFLKRLLTNKARLEEAFKIIMNERCSAILLNKLPSKEKYPGSFTIPCDISQLYIDSALADLGASISLMPYTMYKKLGLGQPKALRGFLTSASKEKGIDGGSKANSVLSGLTTKIRNIDGKIIGKDSTQRKGPPLKSILKRPNVASNMTVVNVATEAEENEKKGKLRVEVEDYKAKRVERFRSVVGDSHFRCLMNKGGDILKEEQSIPPKRRQIENKGLLKNKKMIITKISCGEECFL